MDKYMSNAIKEMMKTAEEQTKKDILKNAEKVIRTTTEANEKKNSDEKATGKKGWFRSFW